MASILLPILLLTICAFLVAVGMLAVGCLVGPKRSGEVKQMPYESGMDPIHDARRRFDVRFHLVALAFLIFDVEILFLYPWAVATKHADGLPSLIKNGDLEMSGAWLIFGEAMLFLGLLTVGFVYAWRKGVFRWR
jgi:NADH-quinone oxidoreductase subunit A